MDAIVVKNLVKKYGNFEVLKRINLNIKEGEFYSLMGPNGSGKTTLASIIASVKKLTSGEIEIYGESPHKANELIGFVPQQNFSISNLTGKENLIYFARILGYSKNELEKLSNEILDKVGLLNDANKRVSHYSGGMRKRLEVSTVLFPSIKIFILDEPTTGLDPSARRNFFGLINKIKRDKTTILLITHIGSDAELASRVGLMDNGKIIAEGTPEALKKDNRIENVVNIETSIKNKEVCDILSNLSKNKDVLETEVGYRIYSDNAEKVIPNIFKELEGSGCKVTQVESITPTLEDVFFKLTGKAVREVGE